MAATAWLVNISFFPSKKYNPENENENARATRALDWGARFRRGYTARVERYLSHRVVGTSQSAAAAAADAEYAVPHNIRCVRCG